ncbi:hypothetical protein NC99_04870 [Sunxiuqinia dokdonensis]|uniref:Uncharacterized protein n=1 Tax=Sunxiuqinia dokdonensis TaxID=1409788 RepID=A0A0L8VET2_9BACT|nr:hypothetical protein NC99_04870 [Sunxiuqinia dokdonensis]
MFDKGFEIMGRYYCLSLRGVIPNLFRNLFQSDEILKHVQDDLIN